MKNLIFTTVFFLCVAMAVAQEKKEKMLLGIFSSHVDYPEYVYGKVKEIHYQPYWFSEINKKVVKGAPVALAQSGNVLLWQPWSYYYNEAGQLIEMTLTYDNQPKVVGVVHYANNRISNIYWLRNDTVQYSYDYRYLPDGTIERSTRSIQNNAMEDKCVFQLDSMGFPTRIVEQGAHQQPVWTTEYTRNADGTTSSYKGIDSNGNVKHYYKDMKYNDQGMLESLMLVKLNGKELNEPSKGNIEYEYDEKGNWVRCINRGTDMVIERSLVYY